jgi:hypothetical protein
MMAISEDQLQKYFNLISNMSHLLHCRQWSMEGGGASIRMFDTRKQALKSHVICFSEYTTARKEQ